ncbi:hypothetical protein [Halohasta salina]|uniref:hypothetical protein n=1 Tax=Halohasta salina TaxID=2961621 RepID=UPI0020A46854|nr:hypothetical protein [Halohasta salina]
MTDTDPAAEADSSVPTATADESAADEVPSESIDVLVRRLVTVFKSEPRVDLETIRERTTVRNVINYRALNRRLDPGWAVDPEIVKFGDEPLADALVFSHTQRSYDVILKPVDIFLPTDEIELYVHDRNRGIRHRLVQTTSSLALALDHAASTLTHRHFNPDAPYLASLVDDTEADAAAELVDAPFEDVE